MLVAEPETLVKYWFEDIYTQGNLDLLDDLVAPDFIAHAQCGDGATCGREAFKVWLRWYRATFTDAEWTIHDVISSGDKVVVRYSGWTTYRGGLLDIPSTNQRVLKTGIIIYHIKEGKVQEIWSEMNDVQVMQQLNAFSLPTAQLITYSSD